MTILSNFRNIIKELATKYDFALCGVVETASVNTNAIAFLNKWIENGQNADMDWFKRNQELRNNPSLLIENAQTIVVMAFPYAPIIPNKDSYNIASYAQDTDYHFVLKSKLNQIISELKTIYGQNFEARAFADSAPIMERYWAVKAGFGWIGKSGMLINKNYGSYLLLSEIIIDRKSDAYDIELSFNGCGKCEKCIEQCPTGAICNNKSVDARKCISYLTIEHRGDFSKEQKKIIHNAKGKYKWIYGCDTCIDCCPWNKRLIPTTPKIVIDKLNINFKDQFEKTPIYRSGKKVIQRNIQEIGNENSVTSDTIGNLSDFL